MFCNQCGERLSEDGTCPKCSGVVSSTAGDDRDQAKGTQGITVTIPPIRPPDQDQLKSFLNFEKMITPVIMKAVYILGSIGIVIFSFASMFLIGGAAGFFSGLLGGIIGLVVFRIVCEQMVLFFSIHRELIEIKNK